MALIDMAYAIDPSIRVFTIDTGRLPQETHDLIEQLRERYRPPARAAVAGRAAGPAARRPPRPEPVPQLGREAPALLQRPQGAAADTRARRARRLGHRPPPRPVGEPLRHPQDRDRPRPRRIVKLNPLAEWTEEEVWDYLRDNDVPVHPLYAQGYTSIGCAPVHPARRRRRAGRAGRWWWESGRTKGVRHALRDRDRRLRARAARDPRRGGGCVNVALAGEEREVALAEVAGGARAAAHGRLPRRCSTRSRPRSRRERARRRVKSRSSIASSSSGFRPDASGRSTGRAASRRRYGLPEAARRQRARARRARR